MKIDEIRERDLIHDDWNARDDRHYLLKVVDALAAMCEHLGGTEAEAYIQGADAKAGDA